MEIIFGGFEYLIKVNWKLFVENGVDVYYLLFVYKCYLEYLNIFGIDLELYKCYGCGEVLGNGYVLIISGLLFIGWLIVYWSLLFLEVFKLFIVVKFECLVECFG